MLKKVIDNHLQEKRYFELTGEVLKIDNLFKLNQMNKEKTR